MLSFQGYYTESNLEYSIFKIQDSRFKIRKQYLFKIMSLRNGATFQMNRDVRGRRPMDYDRHNRSSERQGFISDVCHSP